MRIPIQVLVYPVRSLKKGWEYLMLKRVESRGGFWQGVSKLNEMCDEKKRPHRNPMLLRRP